MFQSQLGIEFVCFQNTKLTERCEEFSAREQKLKKDLFDIKTDLEVRDQELSMVTRLNEELKEKLNKEQQNIEDLRQENDVSKNL